MNRRRLVGHAVVAGMVVLGATANGATQAHGTTILPRTRSAGFAVSPNAVALDGRTGRVFVTDGRHNTVNIFKATNGALLRAVAVGPNPLSVAVDPRTRRVFIANAGHKGGTGSVSVLDEASGAVLRSVAAGQNPTAVTVDESTARVFVIKNDGVGVLDARTGTLLRTVPVSIISSPTVTIDQRRGRAFVASAHFNMLGQPIPGVNLVSVLDATSGALLRRIPLLHGPIAVAVDDRSGRVFSANLDGTASMLDPGTGAVVRTVSRAPAAIGNAVAVDSRTGRVFVSAYNPDGAHGHVSVLDVASGALLQTITVGNEPYAVAVAERTGHVFILSASGVSMLDARSGRVLHIIKLVANSAVVDERTNRVFVSEANGMVDLIDARSGAIVHTPAIG